MSSWKTTSLGVSSILGTLIHAWFLFKAGALNEAAAMSLLPTILAGVGLIVARDNDKTSEDVGAAPARPTNVSIKMLAPIVLLCTLPLLNGCYSTPSRVAYTVVAAPAVSVEHAMFAWGDYVQQFHPSAETEQKVKALYDKYRAAELEAISDAKIYADLTASGNTNNAGAKLRAEMTSQAMQTALTDLVRLLQSLGVKL